MVDFIVWAAICQGFFLSLLYLFSKTHNSYSNKILAFFLLSLLMEALNVFGSGNPILGYPTNGYFTTFETKLFFSATFMHYVVLKLGIYEKYRRFILTVYGLGMAVLSFTFVNIFLYLFRGIIVDDVYTSRFLNQVFMTQQVIAYFLTILVFVFSILELKNYQNNIQKVHSNLDLSKISWLWQFIFLLLPMNILWGVELLRIAFGGVGTSNIVFITWGLMFAFIYFVSYKAFVNPDLYGVKKISPEETDAHEVIVEGEKSETVPEEIHEIVKILDDKMEKGELYLKSELTIHDFAKEAGLPARKISQGINQVFGLNFSEWVNKYRVEKAKQYLNDFSQGNFTIEGIGYESGFNSRSSMYLAFKKVTGRSPGDFKR